VSIAYRWVLGQSWYGLNCRVSNRAISTNRDPFVPREMATAHVSFPMFP